MNPHDQDLENDVDGQHATMHEDPDRFVERADSVDSCFGVRAQSADLLDGHVARQFPHDACVAGPLLGLYLQDELESGRLARLPPALANLDNRKNEGSGERYDPEDLGHVRDRGDVEFRQPLLRAGQGGADR